MNQADRPAVPFTPNDTYREPQAWEIVRQAYETIHTSGLFQFTFAWVEALYADLEAVRYELEHLSVDVYKELLEVAERVEAARNELRLARFLFDVEEINPLHRLIMRNRAVLRCECLLSGLVSGWPRG